MCLVAVFVKWVAAQDTLRTRTLNFAVTSRHSAVPAKLATCNHCSMLSSLGVGVSCCPGQLLSVRDMLCATRTGEPQLETLAKQSSKVLQRSRTGCFDASACGMVLCFFFRRAAMQGMACTQSGPCCLAKHLLCQCCYVSVGSLLACS